MAFKKPESFDGLSKDDLNKLNDEALAEGRAIIAKNPEELSDEEIAQAEALMTASAEIEEQIASMEQAEADRIARIEALKNGLSDNPEPVDEEEDVDSVEDPEPEPEPDPAPEAKEPVTASAPKSTVRIARRRSSDPAPPPPAPEEDKFKVTLVAAANVPGVVADSEFPDMLAVAKAFDARSRSFTGNAQGMKPKILESVQVHNVDEPANIYALSDRHQPFGVAQIRKPEYEFTVTERMSPQDQYDMVMSAAKEARLPGGNLIAAGGWCAPSEQIYGFCELETVSGMLSIPEVVAKRGGISFTKGPDYAALAAAWGFQQTEAQAIAGNAKACYSIVCPPWQEERLDVVGFCVTAPVLTNAAFPELTNRVLQIGAVAHAHKVNAYVINEISTFAGAAINWVEIGGATSDVLDAASLQAERLRYTYSLAPSATIEAIFPLWYKGHVQADIGRRANIEDPLKVTDNVVNSYFAARNIRVQFVYDYQPLGTGALGTAGGTATWTGWPTTVEFMMYPAGAFTKLTKDVIDLDTIYDSVGLGVNNFTAAFFEEGVAVANTCAGAVKVAVALDTRGSIGYPRVGAGTGVTIP